MEYNTQLLTNGDGSKGLGVVVDGSKWLGVEIIFKETFKREREIERERSERVHIEVSR